MQASSALYALHRERTRTRNATPWSDREIASAIEYAVELAYPELSGLECLVQDGIVILRGQPDRIGVAPSLLALTADIPGVRHVIDRLSAADHPLRRAA